MFKVWKIIHCNSNFQIMFYRHRHDYIWYSLLFISFVAVICTYTLSTDSSRSINTVHNFTTSTKVFTKKLYLLADLHFLLLTLLQELRQDVSDSTLLGGLCLPLELLLEGPWLVLGLSSLPPSPSDAGGEGVQGREAELGLVIYKKRDEHSSNLKTLQYSLQQV